MLVLLVTTRVKPDQRRQMSAEYCGYKKYSVLWQKLGKKEKDKICYEGKAGGQKKKENFLWNNVTTVVEKKNEKNCFAALSERKERKDK